MKRKQFCSPVLRAIAVSNDNVNVRSSYFRRFICIQQAKRLCPRHLWIKPWRLVATTYRRNGAKAVRLINRDYLEGWWPVWIDGQGHRRPMWYALRRVLGHNLPKECKDGKPFRLWVSAEEAK